MKQVFFPLEVFYPSQAGGPANTIYWITKNLTKFGFQPVIVATDKGIQSDVIFNKWISFNGIKVIYIKTRFLNFPIIQTLISFLNFYRADIVHPSSIFYPAAFCTAFAARLFRKKIIWSPRGELDPAALNHSRFRKMPILWAIKQFIGSYPVFHSTCDEETQYILETFGKNTRVVQIPNYLELPVKLERQPSKYLLYIGRIHPKKAIDNLIKGLAISKSFLNSDFKLKIAGRGKKRFETDLVQLIKDLKLENKIEFAGQIEGEEKQRLLANAYFTIMPSHSENFGIVVLESLAQTTPVIASKGTPWSSLENEKVGFWIDNSPESLAKKIDFILEMSESVYTKYRDRCRNFVEKGFDIEMNIDKWIKFYDSI